MAVDEDRARVGSVTAAIAAAMTAEMGDGPVTGSMRAHMVTARN